MNQLILAESLSIAALCAREMGWRQIGTGRWSDDTGSVIRFVDRQCDILSYGRGTVVYLGRGWEKRWSALYPMMKNRGMVLDRC